MAVAVSTLSSVSATSVAAGGTVVVQGSNLDRVTSFQLNGVALAVSQQSASSATLTMPATALSGPLALSAGGAAAINSGYTLNVYVPAVLAGFAPASGVAGTSVTVSGSALGGVTAVTFPNGTVATVPTPHADTGFIFQVPAGADSGSFTLVGVPNPVSSAGAFAVLVPATVSSLSSNAAGAYVSVLVAGQNLDAVSAATIGGAGADIVSASSRQLLLMAPISSTGEVLLTAPGNAALSAGVVGAQNFSVGSIDFAQVYSRGVGDASMRLTQGRQAVVRASVLSAASGMASPAVSVEAWSAAGSLLGRLTMTGPATLPSAKDDASLANTFNALLPDAWVQPGMQVIVKAANGATPVFQQASPSVAGVGKIRVVLVSLATSSGNTGAPDLGTVRQALARTFPYAAADISVQARATPLDTSGISGTSRSSDWWEDVLALVERTRKIEDPEAFWYALAPTRTNDDGVGLAYLNDRATGQGSYSALGVDGGDARISSTDPFGNSWPLWLTTMLHELGHNHSLKHVACDGEDHVDTGYPYPQGDLGPQPLYNSLYAAGAGIGQLSLPVAVNTDNVRTGMKDVMSYCDGAWFSDFSYLRAQQFAQARNGTPTTQLREVAPQNGYLTISGRIDAAGVRLRPAMASSVRLRAQAGGGRHGYTLRVVTTAGQTFDTSFDADRIADGRSEASHFWVSVANPGEVASIAVLAQGKQLPQMANSKAGVAGKSGASYSGKVNNGRLELTWNAGSEPAVSVLHLAADGKRTLVAADLGGGSASLDVRALPRGGKFEVSLATSSSARLVSIPH